MRYSSSLAAAALLAFCGCASTAPAARDRAPGLKAQLKEAGLDYSGDIYFHAGKDNRRGDWRGSRSAFWTLTASSGEVKLRLELTKNVTRAQAEKTMGERFQRIDALYSGGAAYPGALTTEFEVPQALRPLDIKAGPDGNRAKLLAATPNMTYGAGAEDLVSHRGVLGYLYCEKTSLLAQIELFYPKADFAQEAALAEFAQFTCPGEIVPAKTEKSAEHVQNNNGCVGPSTSVPYLFGAPTPEMVAKERGGIAVIAGTETQKTDLKAEICFSNRTYRSLHSQIWKPLPSHWGGGFSFKQLNMRFVNGPLRSFLDEISAQTKLRFIITTGLEDCRVTALLRNRLTREALQFLLVSGHLSYQRLGRSDTYTIMRGSNKTPCLLQPQFPEAKGSCVSTKGGPISLKCDNAPLSKYTEIFFDHYNASFFIWHEANNYPVTQNLSGAKLPDAINTLRGLEQLVVHPSDISGAYMIALSTAPQK